MVRITKTPGDDDGCIHNPDSSLDIYTPLVMGDYFHIVAANCRKQDEAKKFSTSQFCKKGSPCHQAREIL